MVHIIQNLISHQRKLRNYETIRRGTMALATIEDVRKKRPLNAMQTGAEARIVNGARRMGGAIKKDIIDPAVMSTGGTALQSGVDGISKAYSRGAESYDINLNRINSKGRGIANEMGVQTPLPSSMATVAPQQRLRNFGQLPQGVAGVVNQRPAELGPSTTANQEATLAANANLANPSNPAGVVGRGEGQPSIQRGVNAQGERTFTINQQDGGYGQATMHNRSEMSPTVARFMRPTGYAPAQRQRAQSPGKIITPNYSWLKRNQKEKEKLFTRKTHPNMPWKERQMLNGLLYQNKANRESLASAERNNVRTTGVTGKNNMRTNQTLSENNMRTNLVNRQNGVGLNRTRALTAQGSFAANDALATSRGLSNEQLSTAMLLQKQFLEEKNAGKKKAIQKKLSFLLGTDNSANYEKITMQEYTDANGQPGERLIGVKNGMAEEIPIAGLKRPQK
ncbi:unknown protein [Desulfotalea psychrophila LSv54]|uniref:Uncharacterized protein n=2 Tax=Desulfotalea psychrophila TaxID=84980 RepID=Q6ALQ4_DESPS|nr:unknown protein [Desulfotalea psychrophila LSv54]